MFQNPHFWQVQNRCWQLYDSEITQSLKNKSRQNNMILTEKKTPTLRSLISELLEAVIVLTLGFGLFIYSSTSSFIDNSKIPTTQTYNSYDFIFIIIYEIIILTIIAIFLKNRHWTFKDFNLDFTLKLFGVAILLVIIRETTGAFLTRTLTAFNILNSEPANEPTILFHSNMVSIVLITVINSIYEEVLLIGYFFKRFEKYHPAIIILVSFLVRASFHTYQGWSNLQMVFVLALVFGIYYLIFRKLWTVIIAHGIGNIFQFLNIHYLWI